MRVKRWALAQNEKQPEAMWLLENEEAFEGKREACAGPAVVVASLFVLTRFSCRPSTMAAPRQDVSLWEDRSRA